MTSQILVVAKSRTDVFGALFFEGLPPHLRQRIRVLEFGRDALTSALAGAAAVVVMRHGLFSFGHLPAAAGWARVPRYYFLDDNFMLVREEPELYGTDMSRYSDDNVRRALEGFEGVLLASPMLRRYVEEHRLHANPIAYPPIAWPILRRREQGWTRRTGEPFRIAFFGGAHRRDLFARVVHPAARQLAGDRPVELVMMGIRPDEVPSPSGQLRHVHPPYELEYGAALETLARQAIDVLAHPTPPSRNNPYKNANVLINARSIGAVAVLSDLPPYDTLGSPAPAVLCGNEPRIWYDGLARLAADPARCDQVSRAADEYCATHFSGTANVAAIERMLAAHAVPGPVVRAARRFVAGPTLTLDRAIVRAKHLARKSRWLDTAARRVRQDASRQA